jgi:hypothetical protein
VVSISIDEIFFRGLIKWDENPGSQCQTQGVNQRKQLFVHFLIVLHLAVLIDPH